MTELPPILEMLENSGLIHGSRIDRQRILRLRAGELSDIGEQAAVLTRAEDLPEESGSFSHSATISLGGGPEPCSAQECRLAHIDQLAQFAAFYSDRVYIHNFLTDHASNHHGVRNRPISDARDRLLNDVMVIQRVRPLIEAGLIVPITATGQRCKRCIAIGAFGTDADKRFFSERNRLSQQFFKEMSVSLEFNADEWWLVHDAPEALLEHGGVTTTLYELPEPLRTMPRLLSRALKGERVPLSATVRRKLKRHEAAADDVLSSVLFEMATSQALGTAYLSERTLPIRVLSAVSGDPNLLRRNSLIQQHLTSIVPFLDGISADTVMKVRASEGDAFLTYRSALNKAVDEVARQRDDFTSRDARGIYSDVVAPGLARLDQVVKSARRSLVKETGRSLAGWTAAISFGMYSGLLPAQLLLAAKALGLTKVVADVTSAAGKLLSPEDSIKTNDLYFLWKLRQKARK